MSLTAELQQNRYFTLASADIVVPNQDAWHLFWDFTTLREIIDNLPGNSPLQNLALKTANEIMNIFDVEDPVSSPTLLRYSWYHLHTRCDRTPSRNAASWPRLSLGPTGPKRERMSTNCATMAKVQIASRCGVSGIVSARRSPGGTLLTASSGHIDTAWLWPYSVTQQKVARSWSTQVDLMNRYPEHHFTCSSAQQYKWLEQVSTPSYVRTFAYSRCSSIHPCLTRSRKKLRMGCLNLLVARGSSTTETCHPAKL